MWLFRGRNEDDDSDFESDYDSDEYETESDEEEEALDSNSDKSMSDHEQNGEKQTDEQPPEGAETEEDYSDEDDDEEVLQVQTNQEQENGELERESQENGDQLDDDESSKTQQDQELDDEREESREELVEEESSDEEEEEEEEEEEATSIAEKRALLSLAAENDRVDILKAILTSQDRDVLLNSTEDIPPLHVAISYGSTNATSCLLRMGANPSIRPETKEKRYAQLSGWELAFGTDDIKPIDMAPSKREGIRHAFTAEALRCIGSDEVERLQHLVDSGMPPTIDIGGKNLYGWSVEMDATKCQELTKPFEPQQEEDEGEETTEELDNATSQEEQQEEQPKPPSAVVSHLDSDSLLSLDNRLEELESLSKALSTCLDNLAEEVSVCHGLLLLGGGASALASHVKSLKVLKERRETELEQCVDEWNDAQDELAYWLQQNGGADGFDDFGKITYSRKLSFTPPENEQDEEAQRRQLKAQIAASENKVRKLRASIADLSEESARDLVEVEKRGLSGGINLVRTLREELREVEYELSEAKSGTAACRARVNLIVSRLDAEKKKAKHEKEESNSNGQASSTAPAAAFNGTSSTPRVSSLFADEHAPTESERIASGDSEAIALRPPGNRGYLPIDLWDILLRIIGFGRVAVKKSVRDTGPSAMII